MDHDRAPDVLPGIPLLGMIVDRTSFDETDDYGVDRDALESTSWSQEKSERTPVHPTVMKNGKVRRRLRWRPKNMMKRRRSRSAGPPNGVPQVFSPPTKMSSNASISSSGNSSQYSRRSGKSIHSFASTETAEFNNTKKAHQQNKRFPLPRPNYSDNFAGVATIGSEGDLVHSRMLPGKGSEDASAVFASADSLAAGAVDANAPFDPYGSETPKRSLRKPGFPPLFNQRKKQQRIKGSPGKPPLSAEQTLERTVRDLLKPRSSDSASGARAVALPSLNSEEMELERRVDLRIRRPAERRESLGSGRNQRHETPVKKRPIDVDDLALLDDLGVDELRADSESSPTPKSTGRGSMRADSEFDFSTEPTPKRSTGRSTAPVLPHSYSTPEKGNVMDSLQLETSRSAPLVTPSTQKSMVLISSPTRLRDEEIQFSMTVPVMYEGYEDERTPPSPPSFGKIEPDTGPTLGEVEDALSLEVEKNLEAIHEMAAEHLQYGEYSEALEVFEEILRGQLARYGQDHYRVGTALHNIAIVHMKRGDFVNAAKACKEAVRIRKIALDPIHPEVAVSLAQLGVAYMETEKHAKAISVFREALRIRRLCLGPRHPKVAKILNNIGCALYELNELEVAKVAFEEALSVQRDNLRETQCDSPQFSDQSLLSIASTLSNLGSIKLYWGMHHDAGIDLEEVLLLQQSVLGDDHPVVQRTQESLTWVENARNQDVVPSLSQLSGLSSKKKKKSVHISSDSKSEQNMQASCAPSIDKDMQASLSCAPSVAVSVDNTAVTGSTFEALERGLRGLNLDFGCGAQDVSDSEVSD
jgi:tetratricopeptide (TPR) repeat protein